MYCISIREEGNSLPEGTATTAQQSRLSQADRQQKGSCCFGFTSPGLWSSRGTSDGLALGRWGRSTVWCGCSSRSSALNRTQQRLQQHQQHCCIHVWRDHVSREHSTAAVGFHIGGRPHKRNYRFVLTWLVLGGLHQRSGVARPTGRRADPSIGNEALAGTRRSVFFWGGDVALYCSDSIHETAATPSVSLAAVVTRTTLSTTLSTRQQLRPPFRWPQL